MNYRHAYHAGNFADCMKHALLIALIQALQQKPKPLAIIDTHAGTGHYDLSGVEAQKTGEWQAGIGRLRLARPAALGPYIDLIERLGLYPGSPAIAAALLRPQDRLIACELHPVDAATLRRAVNGPPNIAIHARDGYTALNAFLPPPERRALILIDPPFEHGDEFTRLTACLTAAHDKFPSGVFAAWYPIKHRAPPRLFIDTLRASRLRDVITCELCLRPPVNPDTLNGCGLLIVNPPHQFTQTAAPIMAALAQILADPTGTTAITREIDE
ncbi:MAG: 23S rRNA (adenine(2030)-N(6))-methyltransferase RlmJ [Acidocella sp.]|nr:23S rRNA (adenine(2030)-N(6))-methyltransferase RlmJ [Acidocella sp.]